MIHPKHNMKNVLNSIIYNSSYSILGARNKHLYAIHQYLKENKNEV